ncbi:protein BatD, partial [Xanthomonas sp. Kuri4-1]
MMGRHRSRALVVLLGLAASLGPVAQAEAETRAWLDRDSVGVGETVTLNIETDQRSAEPDYAPLQGAFGLSAQTGSRQMQVSNGTVSIRSLFGVALSPRRAGEMTIPALRVGNELTAPLRLSVGTAA